MERLHRALCPRGTDQPRDVIGCLVNVKLKEEIMWQARLWGCILYWGTEIKLISCSLRNHPAKMQIAAPSNKRNQWMSSIEITYPQAEDANIRCDPHHHLLIIAPQEKVVCQLPRHTENPEKIDLTPVLLLPLHSNKYKNTLSYIWVSPVSTPVATYPAFTALLG